MVKQNVERGKLDDEECFALWYRLGSVERVASYMAQQGRINPSTRRPYRHYSIWSAAIRWVLHNKEKAYPYFKKANPDLTQEQWEKWLVKKAMAVLKRKKAFFNWIDENNFRKYEYLYLATYGKDRF